MKMIKCSWLKPYRLKSITWSFIRTLVILGVSFVILRPVLTKISSSLMIERDLFDSTVRWIPKHFTLDNYKAMFIHMKYPSAFLNSTIFSLVIAGLQLASCTMVGYGLARFKFRGSGLLFGMVILTLLIPPQIISLPLYLNFRFFTLWGLLPKPGINLLGSYWPFILMAMTATGLKNGLFIYIMRQTFRGMPKALEEAAYVDGAGRFRTFLTIMAPGAIPSMITCFLFAFVWQWNDYYFVTLYMSGRSLLSQTLDVAAHNYAHSLGMQFTTQYISLLNNAGMMLFILPLLVLYGVLQRYFIESIERTGIVG